MRIYFDTPERIARLDAAASRWIGTPFRENSAVCGPGGGVSCHFLTAELLFESGHLERFAVPTGSARKLLNRAAGAMVDFIDTHLAHRFAKIDPTAATGEPPVATRCESIGQVQGPCPCLPGDFITLREAERRFAIHSGIVVSGGQYVHVLLHEGVSLSLLADPTFRVESIRRPLA